MIPSANISAKDIGPVWIQGHQFPGPGLICTNVRDPGKGEEIHHASTGAG